MSFIYREDAIKAATWEGFGKMDERDAALLGTVVSKLRHLPAAPVRPVVKAEWLEKPYLLGTSRFCSHCGSNYGMPHEIYNWCPNCGADMRQGEEETHGE